MSLHNCLRFHSIFSSTHLQWIIFVKSNRPVAKTQHEVMIRQGAAGSYADRFVLTTPTRIYVHVICWLLDVPTCTLLVFR